MTAYPWSLYSIPILKQKTRRPFVLWFTDWVMSVDYGHLELGEVELLIPKPKSELLRNWCTPTVLLLIPLTILIAFFGLHTHKRSNALPTVSPSTINQKWRFSNLHFLLRFPRSYLLEIAMLNTVSVLTVSPVTGWMRKSVWHVDVAGV